jgi:hypothetical protein
MKRVSGSGRLRSLRLIERIDGGVKGQHRAGVPRGIIAHALKVAQLPKTPGGRRPRLLQHGRQRIARITDFL